MTKIAFLTPLKDRVREVIASEAPAWSDLQFAAGLEPEAQDACAREAKYYVSAGSRIDAALIARSDKLELIQKWGIGVDKIDLKAAEARGVKVAITAGANANAVAEHAIALMFAVARKIPVADAQVRAGIWAPAELREHCFQLRGRTLGIVGLGNIGHRAAEIAEALGMTVIAFDPFRDSARFELCDTLETLLRRADIVSLHLPFTPATRSLLSRERLALMKPGAVLINTGRGEVVDQTALADALSSGALSAAGLDVFDGEPLSPQSALVSLGNIVLTPHSAGSVLDNVANVARHVFRNINAYENGNPIAESDRIVWRNEL